MKILNIHGYGGNAHNSAYNALKALKIENITALQLDYDKTNPETVLEILNNQISENEPDVIIGTSLGGFFAAVLSVQLNIPVILVNPFLMPFLTFPKYIKSYISLFGTISKINTDNVNCIIGAKDELLGDHEFTKDLLYNSRFRIVPDGKHSGFTLPLEDYFKEILNSISLRRKINISVYSRKEAENMIFENKFPENTAVISFYDPAIKRIDKDYNHIDYSSVCENVFYSELDDLDLEVLKEKGYTYNTYFPEADKIAEFVYQAYNRGMDIICQCEYGQSRSAGCAAAILEHFYHTGISVFADYRRYPNQVVYHKIFDALEKYRVNNIKGECL